MSRYTSDTRWVRTRRRFLTAHPTCALCPSSATDVHHIDELGLAGPRAYDWSNLQALCHSCHSEITARFGVGRAASRKREREQHPGLLLPGGRPQSRSIRNPAGVAAESRYGFQGSSVRVAGTATS